MKARGYIALLSVLLISGTLLSLTLTASVALYFAQKDMRGEVSYRRSRVAAYSCAQVVMHALSVDKYRFEGVLPDEFPVTSSSTCRVLSVSVSDLDATIQIQGVSGTSVSPLQVTSTRPDISSAFIIQTWEEEFVEIDKI